MHKTFTNENGKTKDTNEFPTPCCVWSDKVYLSD